MLFVHQSASIVISSLSAVSSLLLMNPATVVSLQNLMMEFVLCLATQLWVKREYSSGLSTKPWGTPVFRVCVMEVTFHILIDWDRQARKSKIQPQMALLNPRA